MLSRLARSAPQVASLARCQSTAPVRKIGEKSQAIFDKESKYGAHNYSPLPVALAKGDGKLLKYNTWWSISSEKYISSKSERDIACVNATIFCITSQFSR